jgi:hypothetical protein
MTYESVPVTEIAPVAQQPTGPEVAPEVIDGAAFLTQHGLESIAGEEFEAHGGTFTFADAIDNCPPLAGMISSLSESLKDVPGHEDIIKNAIISAGTKTAERELPDDAKKKLKN